MEKQKFSCNKMSDLFTNEIRLGKFQTFLEHMKNAASKQNGMKIICQEHQNSLFSIYNEEVTMIPCDIKEFLNNNKIFVEQKNNSKYK